MNTTEYQDIKLAPCPFCGGEAYFERKGTGRQSCIVRCGDCGASKESGETFSSGSQWNRRVIIEPPHPFAFKAPNWVNRFDIPHDDPKALLQRAKEAAGAFYPMGVQTGVHSMIEWCGVMGEYVKMLQQAVEQGFSPDEVDQHNFDTAVPLPDYMISYFCEKLGCQIKPFIRGNRKSWKKAIDLWFEGWEE